MANQYEKTGYLHQDYRLFYLCDEEAKNIPYHYHDFHKLLWHIRGNVTYCIEGKSYELKPNDIVLVNKGDIHRPVIHDQEPYERLIIYISPVFLQEQSQGQDSLDLCFRQSAAEGNHVLRLPSTEIKSTNVLRIFNTLKDLQYSLNHADYANKLYSNLLFLETMVLLNRCVLQHTMTFSEHTTGNQKILEILDYINTHLTDEITIDFLANTFFISKYYLMHSFKEETGYGIGQYLTNKRLLYANELIEKGTPVIEACLSCGFQNYSTFSRAYKKLFGVSASRQHATGNFLIQDGEH